MTVHDAFTIRIYGQTWTVRFDGELALTEAFGYCEHYCRTIRLDPALPAARLQRVLVHEVLHVCYRLTGEMDEEAWVRMSEQAIMQALGKLAEHSGERTAEAAQRQI